MRRSKRDFQTNPKRKRGRTLHMTMSFEFETPWNARPRLRFGLLLLVRVLVMAIIVLPSSLADEPKPKPAPQRVVIPFDFESRFDDGRYGQLVGDMLWKKLEREGGFVIPESMQDVRAWAERKKTNPHPAMPLAQMKKIVRDDFGADIAIWGKVERVEGNATDVYDFTILVTDFSADPPRTIHEAKARTKTVSEIPHVYVKAALDALYGRVEPVQSSVSDPDIEKRWLDGPNLVQGDFEQGRQAPQGWDPLSQHVRWIVDSDDAGSVGKNHVLRFEFPSSVAETSGVLFYSDYFPVEEGATYRFQCRWRSSGSAVKVFIKCYDEGETKFSERGTPERAGASSSTSTSRSRSETVERREVYRSQQNLMGSAKTWNTHTEDFTPKHTQFTPRWGRVMLYAYYPAGTVDWDDVIVKPIRPAPLSKDKTKRPSLETKVLTEEVERSKKKAK